MSSVGIYGGRTMKFTKKNIDCTIGMLITANAINICSGTLREETFNGISKANMWEYLVYIFDNNKQSGQAFSNIPNRQMFLKWAVDDLKEFLTVRAETTRRFKYVKKEQLFRYVNHFILTAKSLFLPLKKDHCNLSVSKAHEGTDLDAALDLKIQKQSAIVDDLIQSVRHKQMNPRLTKVKVELNKDSEMYVKDVKATLY